MTSQSKLLVCAGVAATTLAVVPIAIKASQRDATKKKRQL